MHEAIEFSRNEDGYLAWLKDHPEGFIINLRQGRSTGYAVLHRATCPYIAKARTPAGGFTERGYRKLAAFSIMDLETALKRSGHNEGKISQSCSRCLAGR